MEVVHFKPGQRQSEGGFLIHNPQTSQAYRNGAGCAAVIARSAFTSLLRAMPIQACHLIPTSSFFRLVQSDVHKKIPPQYETNEADSRNTENKHQLICTRNLKMDTHNNVIYCSSASFQKIAHHHLGCRIAGLVATLERMGHE